MTGVTQIVPNLPPNVNGVGDYALLLAGAMRAHGVDTAFQVANPAWSGRGEVQGHRAAVLNRQETSAESAVLLHYVGYGYQKRGAPLWLVNWLRELKRHAPKTRLITFFHELYAVGPPWRSSFWYSLVQRHVCRQIARLTDVRFTNRAYSAGIVDRMAARSGTTTTVLPVLSNFGEPAQVPPLSARRPWMAAYGGLCRTAKERDHAAAALRSVCERLGIERLISFGKAPLEAITPAIPVEDRGVLSAAEVSALLLECAAGYLDYPLSNLGKSGIYAAYCAHGVLPVVLEADADAADGARRDKNVIVAMSPGPIDDANSRQCLADAAFRWYQPHSLPKIAESISRAILN